MKKILGWLSSNWRRQGCRGKLAILIVLLMLVCCPCSFVLSFLPTPTRTPTPIAVRMLTPMPTHTLAPTPTRTPTSRPTHTSASRPTYTPTLVPTRTPTITREPTRTNIAVPTPGRVLASVTEIVDGDTIHVAIDGQRYTLRYIGIDTPERDEQLGPEASAANAKLVLGKAVYLEKDVSETDEYGRLLRYVWLEGLMVNAELVRLGYAQASTYPPDVKYHDLFLALEREAREAGRGFWAPQPEPTNSPRPIRQPTSPPPPAAPVCDCSYNRYNCKDFATHAAAQACFQYCMQVRGFDVHRLDGDSDGIACESLP